MATRVVGSEVEAAAVLARTETKLRNMIPFWQKLEQATGALDVAEREVWDRRFNTGIRHSPATIKARQNRTGYYANDKGSRATSSSPFFEWTGSLRRAASRFTTMTADKATIDPDRNYEGPLDGVVPNPFSDIVGNVISDERIFDDRILGNRIERELNSYLLASLEAR